MDSNFESKHHEIEDSYWWFVARRDIQYQFLKDSRECRILDIGCAGGHLMKMLQNRGFSDITGIDVSQNAVKKSRERGIEKVYLRDGTKTGFSNETFDVIVSGDVLEHIKDDKKALSEWKRILKKQGKLIIFVPANSFLWSRHDEVSHHFRRYSKRSLVRVIERRGFSIERISYWNLSLFFPVFFMRIANRLMKREAASGGDDLIRVNTALDYMLKGILLLENRILRHINLPMGVSLFAIVRRS